jgi:putative spermidine/putrescine transport system permease protein
MAELTPAGATGAPVTQPARRPRSWLVPGLLAPAVVALLIGYLLPLIWVIRMALNRGLPGGGIQQTITGDSFGAVLGQSYYWKIALTTVLLGVLVAIVCVVVSYPLALFLVRTTSRFRGLLITLAIAPLLTSSVARTYGWMIVLGNQGLVNNALKWLGVISSPLPISNNFTGVVIALVELFVPYAVLAMLSGFGRLDPQLEQAAASLGAGRLRVFTRVTLPLTLPGVLAGLLLVFVLSISAYVTPQLIGGGRVFVLATEIYNQATNTLEWPVASALSIFLMVIFGVAIVGYQRLQRVADRRAAGR